MHVTNFKNIEIKSISTCLKLLITFAFWDSYLQCSLRLTYSLTYSLRLLQSTAVTLHWTVCKLLRRLSSWESQKTQQNKSASFLRSGRLTVDLSSLKSGSLFYQCQWTLDQTHKIQQTLEAEYCVSLMFLNCISPKTVKSRFHFTYENSFGLNGISGVLQFSCWSENKTVSFQPHSSSLLIYNIYFFHFDINSLCTRHHLLVDQVEYWILW